MSLGEKAKLNISYDYAYGEKGNLFCYCLIEFRPEYVWSTFQVLSSTLLSKYFHIRDFYSTFIFMCSVIIYYLFQIGHPAGIPPKADLIFEVELLKIN